MGKLNKDEQELVDSMVNAISNGKAKALNEQGEIFINNIIADDIVKEIQAEKSEKSLIKG
ncbi:hypothetical protein [Phocoenobacter skyensis]|uniref:Uncharacterized protein n=1 Tax=Phocoenobacter skyensis TaxID=97481 RepID=A0A1H7UD34_9PAST|nr:hypothetical protein [Pasteurella skyensis]MDP8080279.1 hypothetical protein [Pasteurella skyensis]MDP8086269.1 hypothetical protein [Pasteurella skyensis]MDP8184602.1 hypothetical protein [Pasteurella skyensis]QLB23579.1 hypothetical protein A6B44_10390 [Pasteurella skyensis]SEL94972.1 hypothetical protein SAMN05444853_10223 [Pasteurella skyensis]